MGSSLHYLRVWLEELIQIGLSCRQGTSGETIVEANVRGHINSRQARVRSLL